MNTRLFKSRIDVYYEDYGYLRVRFVGLEIRQKMLSRKCCAGEIKKIDLSVLLFSVLMVSASRAFI
jgi:hypothetical protein